MSKSNRQRRAVKRRPRRRQERREPDLFDEVRTALADPDPLHLLSYVSTLLAALDPRSDGPFSAPESRADRPTVEELAAMFIDVATPETTALLTVIGALTPDDILGARIRRELASRPAPPADWLTRLADTSTYRAVCTGHTLGDGDNVMLGVRLAGSYELTIIAYIDHNFGTLVKDAFVLAEPIADILARYRRMADDPDVIWEDLTPADARARIDPAVETAAMTFPPLETETWPACRPLLEWITRALPDGGSGYQRPQWDSRQRADLKDRFFASQWGKPLEDADHRDLLESLLWYGTDYGPGDPLRWSTVRVQMLFWDWLPRKVIAPAEHLAKAPDLLRAFVRFAHAEAGLRGSLTDEALAAIDECAPRYLSEIGASGRPVPGLIDQHAMQTMLLGHFAQLVGGGAELDRLDAEPLPDEPFQWSDIPDDVTARVSEVLELADRCCDELLDIEYRTVSRRLLSRIAAGDPAIFRRNGRVETAAAAIIWIAGKANGLFDPGTGGVRLRATDVTDHFGIGKNSAYQRAKPLLRAGGFSDDTFAVHLGSPEYLVSHYRAEILAHRDGVLGDLNS
ncbi:MAG: DUF6398 domain-containing protein [Mycobacterium sp.]|nr:DUF6398 domain-containing protein [Mycobacterium sp.]